MKLLGMLFMLAGLALLGIAAYFYFQEAGAEVSPIPKEQGVRVIFVTPTGTK